MLFRITELSHHASQLMWFVQQLEENCHNKIKQLSIFGDMYPYTGCQYGNKIHSRLDTKLRFYGKGITATFLSLLQNIPLTELAAVSPDYVDDNGEIIIPWVDMPNIVQTKSETAIFKVQNSDHFKLPGLVPLLHLSTNPDRVSYTPKIAAAFHELLLHVLNIIKEARKLPNTQRSKKYKSRGLIELN